VPDADYTYDFFASIKTTINECWNFQVLTTKENGKKEILEGKLVTLIRGTLSFLSLSLSAAANLRRLDKNWDAIRENEALMGVVRDHIRPALDSCPKTLFPMAGRVQGALDTFLEELGLPVVQWKNGPSCTNDCPTCRYCRNSSAGWRGKFYTILQNTENIAGIDEILNLYILRALFYKSFGTRKRVDHYLELCEAQQIGDVWTLYTIAVDDHSDFEWTTPWDRNSVRRAFREALIDKVQRIVSRGRKLENLRERLEPLLPLLEVELRDLLERFGRSDEELEVGEAKLTKQEVKEALTKASPATQSGGALAPEGNFNSIFTCLFLLPTTSDCRL
jgi:hypothetical protein